MAKSDPNNIKLLAAAQLKDILQTLESDRSEPNKVLAETSKRLYQLAGMIVLPVPPPSNSSSASIDCPHCNQSVTVTLS